MRILSAIAVLLLLVGPSALSAQENGAPPAKQKSITVDDVNRWIEQLDSERFVDRETATEKLIESGASAVSQLAKALPGSSLESTTRIVHILRELTLSNEIETSTIAQEALEKIAATPGTTAARQAAGALARLGTIRRERAIRELQKLGATISVPQNRSSLQVVLGVWTLNIDENWKGKEKDFHHIKWLTNVQQVILSGPHITDVSMENLSGMKDLLYVYIKRAKIGDDSLVHLKELNQLRQLVVMYTPISDGAIEHLKVHRAATALKFFGTKMTKQGAQTLRDALQTVTIDHRMGAFLGIGCAADPKGCLVTIVHPGSSASKAGLRQNDIIAKFNGKKVFDFESLTKLIGENAPGDTVPLEVIRGTETFTKKLTLGEWE